MKTILIIIGTRPEAIKLAPIILYMGKSLFFKPIICITGQHKLDLVMPVLNMFSIKPDYILNIAQYRHNLPSQNYALLKNLSSIFDTVKPSAVLVQGDTTSCFVGALLAFYHQTPVGHVEAGLRTNNLNAPFPEEGYRQLVSRIANYHFVPTSHAAYALRNENINKKHIWITGNTVIDAIHIIKKYNIDNDIDAHKTLFPNRCSNRKYILVTLHRREIFGKTIHNILYALNDIAIKFLEIDIILINHPNPNVSSVLRIFSQKRLSNFIIIPPQPYHLFIDILARSHFVMTDSGGLQEEAPTLNKPILVLRDHTEREEGIVSGCSIKVGTNQKAIYDSFIRLMYDKSIYENMSSAANPYGDGNAAERICNILEKKLTNSLSNR